jgi:hypothetical protein
MASVPRVGDVCRLWIITAGATFASTYLLDMIATAAGLAAAASGLQVRLSHTELIALLAGSYLVWGAGLWANLGANRELLEATGISTNIVSKAAFGLTQRWTPDVRARRAAAAVGYAGTEIVKEIPYYLGAFGAALAADAVSAPDALMFLAGTNIGAAAYEYGLCRLVRHRLSGRGAAACRTDWSPQIRPAKSFSGGEADRRR